MQCDNCKFKMKFKTIDGTKLFYCAVNINTYHLRMRDNNKWTFIDDCENFIEGKPVTVDEYKSLGEFLIAAGTLIKEEDWEYFKNKGIQIGGFTFK